MRVGDGVLSTVRDFAARAACALAIGVLAGAAVGAESDRGGLQRKYEELREEFRIQRVPDKVRGRIETLLAEQRQVLGEKDLLVLQTEILLAKILRDVGELDPALAVVGRTLDALVQAGLEASFDGFEARIVKGTILYELGRLRLAAIEYERVLSLPAVSEVSTGRFIAYLELVLTYKKLGRLGEAAAVGERAVQEMSTRLDGSVRGALLDNLAGTYLALGRIPEAVDMQQRAQTTFVQRYGETHEVTLGAAGNLAEMLVAAGRQEEALRVLSDAALRLKSMTGVAPRNYLLVRTNYANRLLAAGQLDEAEREYAELLALWERQFGRNDSGFLDTRYGLARVQRARGRLDAARREMESVCAEFERTDEAGVGLARQCRLELAGLLWELGDRQRARDSLSVVLKALEERLESGRLTDQSQQALLSRWLPSFRQWVEWSIDLGDAASAFAVSERMRARQLLRAVVFSSADSSGALSQDEIQRLASLKEGIEELNVALQSEDDGASRARLVAQREDEYRKLIDLRANLRVTNPRYAALTEVRTVGALQAAALLAAGDVAVSYVLGHSRMFAFVLTSDRSLKAIDLGPLDGLEEEVRAAVALLQRDATSSVWQMADGSLRVSPKSPEPRAKRVEDWTVAARRLGHRLVEPLAPYMRGRKKVLVVPDGFLARLPIEPLTFRGRSLVESHVVTYVQSFSVLAALRQRQRSQASSSLLSVGAPDFGDGAALAKSVDSKVQLATLMRGTAGDPNAVRRAYDLVGAKWEPLPGAQREIQRAQALFSGRSQVRALIGEQASEQQLQAMNKTGDLAKYRIVHVATHVWLEPNAPALSAIVLSQTARTPVADGYLTAAELSAYKFDTDVVVMSACDSGRGTEMAGEGVLGLPYALFVAGNRAAMLTLWRVIDDSTSRFTVGFLEGIAGGRTPTDSLAAAKRRFIRDPRWSHPQHWAPFVLYGE